MKSLPAAPAEPADPAGGGGEGQREHQQEAHGTGGDVRPLEHVLQDRGGVEEVVQHHEGGKVHAGVEEGEQPQHAPQPDEAGVAGDAPERRHRQREHQEHQREGAGGVGDELHRVGAEPAGEEPHHEPGRWNQRRREDQSLEPGEGFAPGGCLHASSVRPRCPSPRSPARPCGRAGGRIGPGSVELLQVHPLVQVGHLLLVAVEHERLLPEEIADAALARLAPAGMVHRGIDVGIEAVLLGSGDVP